jgi:V-type H+-transporting ATPase subunit C
MFSGCAGFVGVGTGLAIADLLQTQTSKQADRAKQNLENKYSYLAGNAFGRDKKGRMQRDDPGEMHATGEGAEYTPYVFYEFEFN